MKFHKRLFGLLLALFCLWSAAVPVLASPGSSLTIHYAQNGIPLRQATFSLYLVAQKGADGQLTVAEDFSKYSINFTDDMTRWPALASTLAAYATFGRISPTRQGQTDWDGLLSFSGLSNGIYLVVGHLHNQNGYTYTADPALVSLTGKHLDIFPKAEWVPDAGGDEWEEETLKVLKIWEDNKEENRPTEITVHLLQDGQILDTVTLLEQNRWSHSWAHLPAGHDYTVVEECPEGYTVSIRRQGITFVVTNTAESDEETPPPSPSEEHPEKIPVTGQPWAIVLMLTAAGLLLLVIGLYIRRGKNHET